MELNETNPRDIVVTLKTGQPIVVKEDLSKASFIIETSNSVSHEPKLRFSISAAGTFRVGDFPGTVTNLNIQAGAKVEFALPLEGGMGAKPFSVN